ncbi:MAG: DUF2380 domain-containing protein [Methylococcaceae bacterium]|nr:DUF2380 domain-containing protein [Methylococcaceae bacterium]MDP2392612.1 DUF2380 domain-containing protein [Methylococcaceae bacterium]MDP3021113.1 DUF2380 domain-containing protein [Methylococcaceae bacterium]MDP3388499.1 DUF2380 domain-containing protein [Methylococcaceae bacterium]MDZ4157323.1 DUF2380 domain-containing protein [Methylococcales bacterium]
MNRLTATLIIIIITLFSSSAVNAVQRIAVLNFELNDITSLPNTPQEQLRTASIGPLLEQALSQDGNCEIIQINVADQIAANSSFGYLFRFNDLAAKLGAQVGADWIVVGQHSKPSFLFSYLMAHLINVKTQTLAANFAIELKGNHEKVTKRGVRALATKIDASINR